MKKLGERSISPSTFGVYHRTAARPHYTPSAKRFAIASPSSLLELLAITAPSRAGLINPSAYRSPTSFERRRVGFYNVRSA